MKKIIKPAQKEEAEAYSDFSGERFDHDIPEVTLKFEFNYGSQFDDSRIEFDLTDNEAKEILDLIKSKLSQKRKELMKKNLKESSTNYEQCMESRDWDGCEYYGSNNLLYKYFLDQE
jgi:hypothetical protein